MIGFIVPSIGRQTIINTLNSLVSQTIPQWKCFVGFDGKTEEEIDSSILIEDKRINYLFINKKLGSETQHHGNAGQVRNEIIKNVDPEIEWLAFVDDDDSLTKHYIEILELEKSKNDFDCCVFRMRYDKNNQKVLPPIGMNHLEQNYVGISFCVKKEFIIKNSIIFENSNSEDFKFLKQINDKGGKIYLSSHITYNVNSYNFL